ncbi:AAA family ATPase [Rhizobium leguminosarum]|uniref:AAA family ATPase n=1 Tax=Rhizobium leguminosarum TaxID=384 RepID=UPI0014419424|nr:AAA family ATPase [Rhizobium leguminosarum]MBY5868471.1 AAA family ATPase [Rhizobium leguminosarum]NKM07751.1 AAA family ATPase [Rhizobium leguminosarum bv. viciae]
MPRIPVTSDIPIYLATSLDAAVSAGIPGRGLVIVPDGSKWTDFHANLRADLHLVGFEGVDRTLDMRLLIEGERRTYSYIVDDLELTDGPAGKRRRRIDRLERRFVSLLESEADYRELVNWLGFDDAIGCLRRMHDAVLARVECDPKDTAIIELTKGIRFHESVLRSAGTWVAFRQGDRYFTPHGVADVDDAAASFTVEANLPGMIGPHLLDADFGEDFPLSRRALVIVGKNGTGKTRLFQAMIDGFRKLPPWVDAVDTDHTGATAKFTPRPALSRLIVFSSVASDTYPRSIPAWEGIDYRYHRMIGAASGEGGDLTEALLDCLRSDNDTQGFERQSAMALLNLVLDQIGLSHNLYVELTESDEPDTLPSPTRIAERNFLPLFRNMNEQRYLQLYARIRTDRPPVVVTDSMQIRNLSSGEVALMRFAAQAVGSLRRGTIFLFDEPETHLHPHYISQFMEMLDNLLERSGSIAFIATHSAYVVREVPARRVRRITWDAEDGTTHIDPPTMQTFGASIDTISQFVFGDIGPKHRFHHVLQRYIQEHPSVTLSQIRRRFAEDLNPETLSYIAELLGQRD